MTDQSQSSTSLRHYSEVLWRRKWIVVEALVVIPAIVIAVSLLQPTLYSATSRVMAQSQSPSVSVAVGTTVDLAQPDERGLQTLASFVVTLDIAKRARQDLGWTDPLDAMMADVTTEADPNADIINVTAQRPKANEAADLANAFAEQFVAWRKETLQKSLDDAISLIDDQIALAKPDSVERTTLVERRSQLEVLKPLVSGGLTVGEAAQPPSAPSSPKPLRNGALAVAAALVLGVGLAFLRDSLDVKLHSAEEIADRTGLPVVAAIPEFRRHERSQDKLVVLDDPRSPTAEAYRFLRTNLEFVNFNNDLKIVLVTSPLPGQGKSTTIANLAVALIRADKRVAVVEGDLRRPSLHRFFNIDNSRGVTNVVSGASSLADAAQTLSFKDAVPTLTTLDGQTAMGVTGDLHPVGDLKLLILPSGPLPPNPGEIVGSQQFGAILRALGKEADYVLVDAPPMFALGDAAAMASVVDGIIVVLKLDETTADTIKGVEDFFTRSPARALGVVVAGVPRTTKGKYDRYREYYD